MKLWTASMRKASLVLLQDLLEQLTNNRHEQLSLHLFPSAL